MLPSSILALSAHNRLTGQYDKKAGFPRPSSYRFLLFDFLACDKSEPATERTDLLGDLRNNLDALDASRLLVVMGARSCSAPHWRSGMVAMRRRNA